MDSRDDLARPDRAALIQTLAALVRPIVGFLDYEVAGHILAAGWVPGELYAAEQARNATLTDTIQRVEALCTAQGEDSYVMVYALRAALDGPGEEDG